MKFELEYKGVTQSDYQLSKFILYNDGFTL